MGYQATLADLSSNLSYIARAEFGEELSLESLRRTSAIFPVGRITAPALAFMGLLASV